MEAFQVVVRDETTDTEREFTVTVYGSFPDNFAAAYWEAVRDQHVARVLDDYWQRCTGGDPSSLAQYLRARKYVVPDRCEYADAVESVAPPAVLRDRYTFVRMKRASTCDGCVHNCLGQRDHMGAGGCLENPGDMAARLQMFECATNTCPQ